MNDEIKKLGSKLWRLNHLYFIRNKKEKKVQFKLNKVQADFIAKYGRRNIVLKSRQHGFSTFEAIDALDDVLFNPGVEAIIISYDKDSALFIFDSKIMYAMNNLDSRILKGIKIVIERANEIKVEHGNGEVSRLTVKTSGRSGTFSRAHISELPRMEEQSIAKAKEVFEGTLQAVPTSGQVTIEGTARMEDDMFSDVFMEAWTAQLAGEKRNINDWKAFFYNWQWDVVGIEEAPEYDKFPEELLKYQKRHKLSDKELAFYYTKLRSLKMNWASMKKEYPTTVTEAFQATQAGVIFEKEVELWYNNNSITFVPYDPKYPVYVFEDVGHTDLTCIVWVQKVGNEIRVIDYYENKYFGTSHYVDVIKNRGYRIDLIFLPHDAGAKSKTDVAMCNHIIKQEIYEAY